MAKTPNRSPRTRPSRKRVVAIFRKMDALRQSLPKSKDKTSLKELISHGRRF